jgi:hypothetical protein
LSTTVYGGPGIQAYPAIGALYAADQYNVLWEEFGCQFIDYLATINSVTKRKRGYIEGGSPSACPNITPHLRGNGAIRILIIIFSKICKTLEPFRVLDKIFVRP